MPEAPLQIDGGRTLYIGLGKNIGVDSTVANMRDEHNWRHMSLDLRLTATAVGALYLRALEAGEQADILFSTGFTAGQDMPAEAETQRDYVSALFDGKNKSLPVADRTAADIAQDEDGPSLMTRLRGKAIDPQAVHLETESIDTAGNAEKVAEWLAAHPGVYSRIVLVSVRYGAEGSGHVDNAARLFKRYGVRVDETAASEDVVSGLSEHHAAFIADERWRLSERIQGRKGEVRKEWIRRHIILPIDRKGKFLRLFSSRTRG